MKKAAAPSFLIAIALFAVVVIAEAQQPTKVFRIGYLSNTNPARESADSEGIRRSLRELGYLEGQNISIDYRYGEGRRDRGPKLAAELVALNCDVIVVAGGYSWVRAVMNATKTIPIVMAGGGLDPVNSGVIKSLAHPGGNVTGIANLSEILSTKRLELFKEAVPKLARIAVLYDSANSGDQRLMKEEFRVIARALKFTLQSWEIKTADDFEKVFAMVDKQRPDGLYVLGGGGLMNANRKRIVNFASMSRLPSMYNNREYVHQGGLMSYGRMSQSNTG